MLDALPALRADLVGHLESLGAQPESGSRGQRELQGASETEATALRFGRLYAQQSLISGGHSLIALARGLEPPTPEYGTWSIARTILDATSLTCWIMEPDLSRGERARRSLAVQLADLAAEEGFLAALLRRRAGQEDEDGFTEVLSDNRSRRHDILIASGGLGALPGVPEPVERARLLGAEFEYLMCSSILEGRPWALLHTTAVHSGLEMDRVQSILRTQVHLSASWYARAAWSYASWMSRESLPELQSSLEFGYDALALPDEEETRFWRQPEAVRQQVLAAS